MGRLRSREVRLLTLIGTGGVGKTRLAQQAAVEIITDYPDGIWFIDLAKLDQPELVAQTIAAGVGVGEEAGQPIETTLERALVNKRLLLILDNCEHLIVATAQIADRLVRTCQLSILATSREPLRIGAEITLSVPTLETPAPDGVSDVASIESFAAVQLLVDRAAAMNPDFHLSQRNARAVAQICCDLDGLPLALELAAARLKLLSPEELSGRLVDRFQLLTTGSRTAAPRQQSLQSMIDWSYDSLAGSEQALLRRLSVFAGTWTLEAAEAVCAGEAATRMDVLSALAELVDKSLVQVVHGVDDATTYRMLATIREYARGKLSETAEAAPYAQRHAQYYLGLSRTAEAHRTSNWKRWALEWWLRLQNEVGNLRLALAYACDSLAPTDSELGLELASNLVWFWLLHDALTEGYQWLQSLLAAASTSSESRVPALWGVGVIANQLGQRQTALDTLSKGLQLADSENARRWSCSIRGSLGLEYLSRGDWQHAQSILWQALEDAHNLQLDSELASLEDLLAAAFMGDGQFDLAMQHFQTAADIARGRGDAFWLQTALSGCAQVAIYQKAYADSRRYLVEAESVADQLPNRGGGSTALVLGQLALLQGDLTSAQDEFLRALNQLMDGGRRWRIVDALAGLGIVAFRKGLDDRALTLLGGAASVAETLGTPMRAQERASQANAMAELRKRLGPDTFEDRRAAVQKLSVEDLVRTANSDL
jgi:non-specific serine/threonine protein kinase